MNGEAENYQYICFSFLRNPWPRIQGNLLCLQQFGAFIEIRTIILPHPYPSVHNNLVLRLRVEHLSSLTLNPTTFPCFTLHPTPHTHLWSLMYPNSIEPGGFQNLNNLNILALPYQNVSPLRCSIWMVQLSTSTNGFSIMDWSCLGKDSYRFLRHDLRCHTKTTPAEPSSSCLNKAPSTIILWSLNNWQIAL